MTYKCPKCERLGMDEDGRAKVFACLYGDCLNIIRFKDYNPHAAILTGNVSREKDESLPSMTYPLDERRTSNLLKFVYEDLKFRK